MKILVADDEFFIRKKKIKILNELEVGAVSEAENGKEVIYLLENNDYDLLILDIMMPIVNGFEVCEYVYNIKYQAKIIIFSGYNEFEYARTALRYGVSDYLLKPIKQEDLKNCIDKCRKELLETKSYTPKAKPNTIPSDMLLCNKIINLVNANLTNPKLNVALIANNLNMHQNYIGSVFKKIHNKSIIQYITELRMEKAKELLTYSDMKISEVAERIGYTDIFYFSKKYKAYFGYSPTNERLKA